jgi:hypothetical protein
VVVQPKGGNKQKDWNEWVNGILPSKVNKLTGLTNQPAIAGPAAVSHSSSTTRVD